MTAAFIVFDNVANRPACPARFATQVEAGILRAALEDARLDGAKTHNGVRFIVREAK